MKKRLLLVTSVLLAGAAFAQNLQRATQTLSENPAQRLNQHASVAAVTCGNDTVLYPLAKATAAQLFTLVGNGGGAFGEGFSQYYEAP